MRLCVIATSSFSAGVAIAPWPGFGHAGFRGFRFPARGSKKEGHFGINRKRKGLSPTQAAVPDIAPNSLDVHGLCINLPIGSAEFSKLFLTDRVFTPFASTNATVSSRCSLIIFSPHRPYPPSLCTSPRPSSPPAPSRSAARPPPWTSRPSSSSRASPMAATPPPTASCRATTRT